MLALATTFLPFALSTSLTPGPNTIMLAASAANFGVRRTLPHMAGISIGFPAMVIAIGLGLGSIFAALPQIHTVLKYGGAAYLLYLAWKIASAGSAQEGVPGAKPLTFLQAAAFQWVNPKAWIMAIGAISTYTTVGGSVFAEVLVLAGVFLLVSIPTMSFWAFLGFGVGRMLRKAPRMLRAFNIAMAALLVASIVPMFL